MDNENKKVILAYISVCIFWGSTYLAIRIGMKDTNPAIFGALRFIAVGIIMLLFTSLKGYKHPTNKKDIIKISVVGLLLLLLGNGLLMYGEKKVDSGIACLVMSTIPLFIALLEFLIFKNRRLDYKAFLGLLIGFGGVFYLITSVNTIVSFDIKYTLIILCASFSWALGTVYSKTFSTEGSIYSIIGIQNLSGGLGLLVFSILSGNIHNIYFTKSSFLALVYLITFGSIIGYSSYVYIMQKWPATKAGTYAYINPVVAVILGAVILDEYISFSVIISMCIILLGVFMVQKSKVKNIE